MAREQKLAWTDDYTDQFIELYKRKETCGKYKNININA